MLLFCRGDRIRTCDPLVPNQVRYQLRHAPKNIKCSTGTALRHFFDCRGDRIRTCDPLVPNQVRYQLRHAPITFLMPLDILFSNERANLVLFFNNSNNFAYKNKEKCYLFEISLKTALFFVIFHRRYSHNRNHSHNRHIYDSPSGYYPFALRH